MKRRPSLSRSATTGWLLSENAPQYKPSFELNKRITQGAAEHYGLDFALSMIKLRGLRRQDRVLGPTTSSRSPLMAGLAARDDEDQAVRHPPASLVMPPAHRSARHGLDHRLRSRNGRFGLNLGHRLATARVLADGHVAGR